MPPTIAERGGVSSAVLIGQFTGYGEPYWDTADGQRPSPDEVGGGHARILTPFGIGVETELRGHASDAEAATISGGQIGCDKFEVSDNPVVTPDGRYLFFISNVRNEQDGKVPRVLEAWPVSDDEVVTTPLDGDLTIDQVQLALEGKLATPTPWVQSSDEPPDDLPEVPEPSASARPVSSDEAK